ncbi:MAG: thiamine pyrophosphate-dependent dehydrogenase E1 component subunit alpha [Candidatus Omnitrophica bacterium]|nr:thiamine pyrophosphate-dependent dehydrogenase E1 component subunit alpha [Candidatus Omnitrophota bacterium]
MSKLQLKNLKPASLKKIYQGLIKIRKFEEKIVSLYPQQQIRTPVHLYIGQEAIAVGVCLNLRKRDYLFSNHRNHGHLIAKGARLESMLAELHGRIGGCSKGKGGSMHMTSQNAGVFGTSAIVAGNIPIALGCAFASKFKKDNRISVVFFGDGAVDEGTFYECLNFAALKKLPIVFICENNFYATNSPQKVRQVNTDIYQIAKHFKMPGVCVDGNDVFEILKFSAEAIERARKNKGPTLIEARTFRWKTHVGPESDIQKGLRSEKEIWPWKKKCPIKKFVQYVTKNKLLSKNDLDKIDKKVNAQLQRALKTALKSSYPKKTDLKKNVY